MPVERVDAGDVPGLRVDDVLGAVICRDDGIADPAAVTASSFGALRGAGWTCASGRTRSPSRPTCS